MLKFIKNFINKNKTIELLEKDLESSKKNLLELETRNQELANINKSLTDINQQIKQEVEKIGQLRWGTFMKDCQSSLVFNETFTREMENLKEMNQKFESRIALLEEQGKVTDKVLILTGKVEELLKLKNKSY